MHALAGPSPNALLLAFIDCDFYGFFPRSPTAVMIKMSCFRQFPLLLMPCVLSGVISTPEGSDDEALRKLFMRIDANCDATVGWCAAAAALVAWCTAAALSPVAKALICWMC